MHTVILVNIKPVYISNETLQPVEITEKERLLSAIFQDKYLFVELYTPIVKFTAKTFKALDKLITDYSTTNKVYDFHSIIIKK